ncbi:SDR family oxidoreductase [Idiomarina aminovorans]|uniref:SDR family oxidoreductase n=1 Tax=Idiomarina aminovorans TaxID=2914829 RepID=UPI0020055B17|nr:SDR family oxidoreductase [Idiomarina sp. ATCH4]MCK7458115.1 SDR family oxidoreductase [Idiomarina sp. ATCH4]
MKTLLLGYGDIADRVAQRLSAIKSQITGVCRTPGNKPVRPGVDLIAADLNSEQELYQLFKQKWDNVVITLTPKKGAEDSYHQGYVVPCRQLQQVLSQQTHQPFIIYVSSTGVYAQRNGEWIDENSVTEPTSDSGKALLQAESLIDALPGRTSILRCSGIYGQGRDFLLRQLSQGNVQLRDSWTNRIHQDDVAGFIVHLLTKVRQPQPVYLVNDDEPVKQYEVYQWLAQQLGIEPPETINKDVDPRGSKRCLNNALKNSDYQLQYSNFREGYAPVIKQWQR